MLEKPLISEASLIACIQTQYGLPIVQIEFLPIGADLNTAVFRALSQDQSSYFVKLRRGSFDDLSVILPKFLSDQGITHIIAPLADRNGRLWISVDPFSLIVYPFIAGCDGYSAVMSPSNWSDLGSTLRFVHNIDLPPEFSGHIRKETFTPHWRKIVRAYIEQLSSQELNDHVAERLVEFLNVKSDHIIFLVDRADRLAQALQVSPPDYVLCHSDVHPGNVLIAANGDLYLVDWDDPILAPKERDLMFIGGGFGFLGQEVAEQVAHFYASYGQTPIDQIALAYYRYERIIQDIAVECQQIFRSDGGDDDRDQALLFLKSNFTANGTIDSALLTDPCH